jgi:hypothetical protein
METIPRNLQETVLISQSTDVILHISLASSGMNIVAKTKQDISKKI